jgi:hypothetical protein
MSGYTTTAGEHGGHVVPIAGCHIWHTWLQYGSHVVAIGLADSASMDPGIGGPRSRTTHGSHIDFSLRFRTYD